MEGLGDVLGKSFSVFGRHFVVYMVLAASVLSQFYLVLLAAVLLKPDGILVAVNLRTRGGSQTALNLRILLMLVICRPRMARSDLWLSDPKVSDGAVTFAVDLGTAPVEAFEDLLDALEIMGVKHCEIGV